MMKKIKRLISIMLAILCVAVYPLWSFATDVNENGYYVKDGEEYVDADCIVKFKADGEYYCCHKTNRFFPADAETCPYCFESHKQARYYGNQYYFENADYFSTSYALICGNCKNVFTQSLSYYGIVDFYNESPNFIWSKYNPVTGKNEYNFQHCPECGTQITLDDIKFVIGWFGPTGLIILESNSAEEIIASYYEVASPEEWQKFKDEQAGRVDIGDKRVIDAPGYEENENYNPSVWERIVNLIKKIYVNIMNAISRRAW